MFVYLHLCTVILYFPNICQKKYSLLLHFSKCEKVLNHILLIPVILL